MDSNSKFVTVAIHTYDRAVALRDFLAANNIPTELENVNIASPSPACGVRVRIPESSLPKALMLIEGERDRAEQEAVRKINGEKKTVLVPVDLFDLNLNYIHIAFAFASVHNLKPVLLHVYSSPYFDGSLSITDNFILDMRDAEVRKDLRKSAIEEMDRLSDRLTKMMDSGELPRVDFSTQIREGIPEDVIIDFTRTTPPELVVMGTRSVAEKSSRMLGSVAAEVVDSCRVPVFTVPGNFNPTGFASLQPAVFFCNVDQQDLIAMDIYISLFGMKPGTVHLFPVNEKNISKLTGRLKALADYFAERYPEHKFVLSTPDAENMRNSIENLVTEHEVKLLIVPNKKKNVFVRLFSPGIPHKVIFEADLPMLALPV